ncbi:hypothetical protein GCM10022279_12620 [Comamonas faecalis]|uniref:UPF0125 protein GCM10022279_12620 n=1 Tax=Comamonas faecalis TaxID=1387849 RepID=A0ABP7R1U5_9BURK
MAETPVSAPLDIVLAWSTEPGRVRELALQLPPGATVAQALAAAGLQQACADGALHCGIWGRAVALDAPLQRGDRVEVVRDLRVDPKVARRARFDAQGKRAAGLFEHRR